MPCFLGAVFWLHRTNQKAWHLWGSRFSLFFFLFFAFLGYLRGSPCFFVFVERVNSVSCVFASNLFSFFTLGVLPMDLTLLVLFFFPLSCLFGSLQHQDKHTCQQILVKGDQPFPKQKYLSEKGNPQTPKAIPTASPA